MKPLSFICTNSTYTHTILGYQSMDVRTGFCCLSASRSHSLSLFSPACVQTLTLFSLPLGPFSPFFLPPLPSLSFSLFPLPPPPFLPPSPLCQQLECFNEECGYDGREGLCLPNNTLDPWENCPQPTHCRQRANNSQCDPECNTRDCLYDFHECVPSPEECPADIA